MLSYLRSQPYSLYVPSPMHPRIHAYSPTSTNQYLQPLTTNSISEPMNLGSPPTSPHASQFLPSFLFGDGNQSVTSSRYSSQSVPIGSNSRPIQLVSPQISPTGPTLVQPRSAGRESQTDLLSKRCNSPPTKSLWSTATSQPAQQPADQKTSTIRHSTPSASMEANNAAFTQFRSPQPFERRLTPARHPTGLTSPTNNNNRPTNMLTPVRLVDALNAHQNSGSASSTEEYWVTVFGFPTSKASFILNQFSQFGTIEKHVITNNGNWMHIKYQNKLQARCALGRNGRVFGDNIMVGVMICTDHDVIHDRVVGAQAGDFDGNRENSFHAFYSPVPLGSNGTTPLKDSSEFRPNIYDGNRSLMASSFTSQEKRPQVGVARHSSMRALAGNYRSGALNRTTSVRQGRDSGLLSKALGYMFGWS